MTRKEFLNKVGSTKLKLEGAGFYRSWESLAYVIFDILSLLYELAKIVTFPTKEDN